MTSGGLVPGGSCRKGRPHTYRVGGRLTPTWTRVREGDTSLDIAVRAPARAHVRSVTALVYPQATFGHQDTGGPVPLTGSDGHFAGTLDLTGLPAGEHRVTGTIDWRWPARAGHGGIHYAGHCAHSTLNPSKYVRLQL